VGSELTPGVRVEAVTVPDSLDWGDKGGISLIQDQGTNCVAGWAFASVAAAETMTYLGNRTIGFFSEEYVLECTSGGSCKGGDLLAGMKLMLKNGAPPRLLYPYTADSSTTPKTSGICDKTWNL
jgi:cathepsin L